MPLYLHITLTNSASFFRRLWSSRLLSGTLFAALTLEFSTMLLLHRNLHFRRFLLVPTSGSRRDNSDDQNKGLAICPETSPILRGPINMTLQNTPDQDVSTLYPDIRTGGSWRPAICRSRHKVAVIIPYRGREVHLRKLLSFLHPVLHRQQLDYGIFVVEQAGKRRFNRGMLMNIGYIESKVSHDYECFVFHDVDLLPEDDRNIYTCAENPKHLSVLMDKYNYTPVYDSYFGGVTALTSYQLETVNGWPNAYWGWGGEDDDMSWRVTGHGFNISRPPAEFARYKMIKHGSDRLNPRNPQRFKQLRSAADRSDFDGLSNLKYRLLRRQQKPLYTWLLVDIRKVPEKSYVTKNLVQPPKKRGKIKGSNGKNGMEKRERILWAAQKGVTHLLESLSAQVLSGRKRPSIAGIHVRRGDIVTTESDENGRAPATREYLRRIVDVAERKHTPMIFIMVNDGKEYCRSNFEAKIFSVPRTIDQR